MTALALTGAQFFVLHRSPPGSDSIEYLEVADQISKVGYAPALSGHWSPLYALYHLAVRRFLGLGLEHEILASMVGSGLLLLAACTVAAIFMRFAGRSLWSSGEQTESKAWTIYALGLVIYLFFGLSRMDLREPDSLVFFFTTLMLGCWCRAFQKGLGAGWIFAAGVCGGAGFLARSNILHWSLVVGITASILAPRALPGKRIAAFLIFLGGLLFVVTPHVYLMSVDKGHFTFGESGKTVWTETYGAKWSKGQSAWPVKLSGGDVRIFTESHVVNFPGFYDPGKEYEDATIPFRFSAALRGFVRAVQSLLFGFWSSSFGLIWPLLWAGWPMILFGIMPGSRAPALDDIHAGSELSMIRRRVAWFLVMVGLAGIGMHLVSFCIGYYLPPYLFSLLTGISLFMLDGADRGTVRTYVCRSCCLVGVGFVTVAVLSTMTLFRDARRNASEAEFSQMQKLATALKELPALKVGFRRLAVAGNWLDLYAVRNSGSQVYGDIPNPGILSDPKRLQRAVDALRKQDVVGLLAPVAACPDLSDPRWHRILGTGWCLLELREGGGGTGSRSR